MKEDTVWAMRCFTRRSTALRAEPASRLGAAHGSRYRKEEIMPISITEEMRRVAASYDRNGERLTADLLFRARAYIADLEARLSDKQKRLDRIASAESQPERTGADAQGESV